MMLTKFSEMVRWRYGNAQVTSRHADIHRDARVETSHVQVTAQILAFMTI
jgi:hypothetical protein